MTTQPKQTRERAYMVLSEILWERKRRKKNTLCVVNGGKMDELSYQRALEEVKLLKTK